MKSKSFLTPVILCAIVLVFTAGCIRVSESLLVYNLPPVPMEEVAVYFESDDIPEHTRVAILAAKGSNMATSRGRMLDELRTRAGSLGANAIIVMDVEEPTGTEVLANALVSGVPDGQRMRDAIAILIEE